MLARTAWQKSVQARSHGIGPAGITARLLVEEFVGGVALLLGRSPSDGQPESAIDPIARVGTGLAVQATGEGPAHG